MRGGISKFASCSQAGVGWVCAFSDECFGPPVEVELDLLLHLALERRTTEDSTKPIADAIEHERLERRRPRYRRMCGCFSR